MKPVHSRGRGSQCPRFGLWALLCLAFAWPAFPALADSEVTVQLCRKHPFQFAGYDLPLERRHCEEAGPQLSPHEGAAAALGRVTAVVDGGVDGAVTDNGVLVDPVAQRPVDWSGSLYEGQIDAHETWWYRVALVAVATLLLVTLLLLHYIRLSRRLRDEAALRREVEATLRKQQDELVRLANTDALTGVWNRLKFETEAAHEIARAERYGLPLSLIFLDLDYFKEVNDRYGHAMGDAILREMCERVEGSLRESDHLCRWGGEEFLILVPHTELERAALLAEKLRHAVAATPAAHGQAVSISLGVVAREDGESLDDLVRKADIALYRAKFRGRNRVEVYRSDDIPPAP